MGNNFSCIPRKGGKRSSDRCLSIKEQVPQEIYAKLQNKPATDRNQDYLRLQVQTRSVKEAKQNDEADLKNRLLYKPIMEWDQSGMKLEDLGKIIHCSRVKISREPCKDINDRCLALFQNHLLILSDDFHGLTYQGMLPLAGITVHSMENTKSRSEQSHAFQITGPLLHPFTVYCSTEEEVKKWLYSIDKQRQASSKTADTPQAQLRRELNHNSLGQQTKNVDLRTLILNQPIHGGERTRINSLGDVIWISEAKLQHLPHQDQHDRLLILFPTTLLILSQEDHTLHYKGELPLNAITIFEQDEPGRDSNTLLIEGKMINQIVVSSQNRVAHQNLMHHLSSAGVTVQKASKINTGCDYKQCRDQLADKHKPSLESHRRGNSPTTVYGVFTFPEKPVEMISVSEDLPAPITENAMDQLVSPDYAEPYTPPRLWFSAAAKPLKLTSSAYKHNSSPLPVRGSSTRLAERNILALSEPPPLSAENLPVTENCLSPGYAEPFAASKMQPVPSRSTFSHKDMANSQGPSIKHQQRIIRTSECNISRLSPASSQLGSTTFNYCSPSDERLNILLSPTYAVPYIPFRLRPAPPAKPGWLRESVARHNSSPLPDSVSDLKVPLRKTLALSQPPVKSNCGFRKDSCSVTAGHLDGPVSPEYATVKKQLAPSTVRLSAAGPVRKQNSASTRDQWSNTRRLAHERLPRLSLPSSSVSESSSCSYMDEKPLTDLLSPLYAEPYFPQPPADLFWIREEVLRRGSAGFPAHCSKDDSSEYYTIIQLLDSYREGKNVSWYSDDSRISLTSSEHTYAELESLQDDSDYEFWDFDFKKQGISHLSTPTAVKLLHRGIVDSRLRGKSHRWS
ncbi:pleckstrin homology domain-containing family N member 1 [Heterodontus francisci]|uniref:pleckstrin homology domain-containing family N member 1 n=1 Tax=Heterodontus francisci TaxID=7792 RepID=UPI00355BBAD2